MAHFTRRAALLGGGALAGGWAAVRYGPRSPVLDGTASLIPDAAPGTLNDASGLSETPVFRHLVISDDPGEALIAALRNEIAEARSLGARSISALRAIRWAARRSRATAMR